MNRYYLHKVSAEDLVILQQISRQTFQETFAVHNTAENMKKYLEEGMSKEKLAAELSSPQAHFYLCKTDQTVVGYLKLNEAPVQTELNDPNSLEIERIYVLNAFQGKKIGQVLLDHAIELARNLKLDYIWLGVWEKNANAIRFYTKNGFVEFDKHLFTLGTDVQTDLLMKKHL